MLNGDMYSCNSGVSYEDAVVAFLNEHRFQAYKTGKSDGGIDIVAVSTTKPQSYTFNIQCKYYNKPLGKAPIQEVYSGTQYYGNGGKPVVVTNNRMTADARVYAKRLGVEVIAEAEWKEIMQVSDTRKIINPNPHKGLMGIIIANITRNREYLISAVQDIPNPPTDKEQLKLELVNKFDEAEEYVKEASYYQQRAAEYQQRALTLQKEALLRNLEYG